MRFYKYSNGTLFLRPERATLFFLHWYPIALKRFYTKPMSHPYCLILLKALGCYSNKSWRKLCREQNGKCWDWAIKLPFNCNKSWSGRYKPHIHCLFFFLAYLFNRAISNFPLCKSLFEDVNDFEVNFLCRPGRSRERFCQPQHGLAEENCWKDFVLCIGFSVEAFLISLSAYEEVFICILGSQLIIQICIKPEFMRVLKGFNYFLAAIISWMQYGW